MIKIKLILFGFIILSSCSNPKQEETELINSITINLNSKNKKNDISEFIKEININMVNDSTMPIEGYPNQIIEYDNGLILIDSKNAQEIYILNNNLKVINIINAFGGGPEEYLEIYDVIYDSEDSKLVVMDLKKMIEYDLDGNFIRFIPFTFNPDRFDYFDNKYIIWNDSRPLEIGNFHRFNLLDKDYDIKDNQIPFNPEEEKFNREPSSAVFKNNKEIFFTSWMNDTIYFLSKNNAVVNKLLVDFHQGSAKDVDLLNFNYASQIDEYSSRNNLLLWEHPAMTKDFFLSLLVVNSKVKLLIQNRNSTSFYLSPSNMKMLDFLLLEALMTGHIIKKNSIKFLAEIELVEQLIELQNENPILNLNESNFEKITNIDSYYAIVTIEFKDKV